MKSLAFPTNDFSDKNKTPLHLPNSLAFPATSHLIIWLLRSKGANTLRALYGDYESTFEELFDKDKSMTLHKKNLQRFVVEIYKTINHPNPAYMWEFFIKKDVPYNLRINELCKIPSVNS